MNLLTRAFCLLAVLLAAAATQAATYFVRAAGNDQAAGTSPPTAFRTVLRAVRALNHGDNLVIGPGVYRETALLAERFSADGSAMEIVGDESGKLTGDAPGVVAIEPADPMQPALRLYRLRNIQVSGLTFRGAGQGLQIEKCLDVLVERSTFDGLTRGLAMNGNAGVRIESCVIARCLVGLFAQRCVNTRVAHVTIAGSNSVGVLALSCGAGEICNTLFAANNTNLIGDELTAAAWTSDHNVAGGVNGPWGDVPSVANAYEWPSASNQDRHSLFVAPSFADPVNYNLRVAADVTWAGGLPGQNVGKRLDPPVKLDRDGKPFREQDATVCVGAFDYPDPRPAAGWQPLPAKFDAGNRQSAGVYAPDGSLLRTLVADAAGVRQLWWDGRDDQGQPVAAGNFTVKAVAHDARLVDDGAVGDDGNPLGAYNCDNADQVVTLPDGGFVISTVYDEAGFALRRYSSSGQPVAASNLDQKDFAALTRGGDNLYGVVGKGADTELVRLDFNGQRVEFPGAAWSYRVFASGEQPIAVNGVASDGKRAFVAAAGMNIVRVIDLATGAKQADWPVANIADVALDSEGLLWAISGKQVIAINASGQAAKQFDSGLPSPRYLAVSPARVAVVDRAAAKLAILDKSNGQVIRTIGKQRLAGTWQPVNAELLRDPRGAAFFADGRLVLTEQLRVRTLWPEQAIVEQDLLSNFMDVMLIHPTKPDYVICGPGIFHVDPKTGVGRWVVESPQGELPEKGADGKPESAYLGSPSTAAVLQGVPYVAYFNSGRLRMVDVSDPLAPKTVLDERKQGSLLGGWAYSTVAFTKHGDLLSGGQYNLKFSQIPLAGVAGGIPTFDYANAKTIGVDQDPSPRGMKAISALAADRDSGDIYYLAVTALKNKMVPGWGADGTGMGRSTADGKPLWFAPSSGGNYMSISTARASSKAGEPGASATGGAFIFAGKSFGGQLDVFDADGLRITTGNWSWPSHYQIGFVDLRYGVQAYVRPDGKLGAYVEDDAIGRFARCRLDGAETLKRSSANIAWNQSSPAAAPPDPHATAGPQLPRRQTIPKVAAIPVDGKWDAWEEARIEPQIVMLPVIGYKREVPDDIWQTFRTGTGIGAVAHDGTNLYTYFLVVDDSPRFDAPTPGVLWMYDGIELWLEEEQLGLGLTRDGTPSMFKFRHHSTDGKPFAANYGLPRENIWAEKLPDVAAHPLGRRLQTTTGTSLEGRPGYIAMGKIPFEHVKLVGGIAGRDGTQILPLANTPGEVIRIGVAIGGVNARGREQDFKTNWPSTLMFSDPTRSAEFVLGQ